MSMWDAIIFFTLRRESLNLITATGVVKLMITEHCKIEINTFVSFPNGLLLDSYSRLYFSHPVNINKVGKAGYIYHQLGNKDIANAAPQQNRL